MYLVWLRVAAVLYAAASIAAFPAVLQSREVWRKACVQIAGMALLFHFVSVVEMLALAHSWLPVGVREGESLLGLLIAALFFLLWWIYGTMSLAVFALPITFFIVFVPSLGYERYIFPSAGVRISWLIAHISALLAAYTALGFSMLASVLYLVQERRILLDRSVADAQLGAIKLIGPMAAHRERGPEAEVEPFADDEA